MYNFRKHRGDAMISSIIAAVVTGALCLGVAKTVGTTMQSQSKVVNSVYATTYADSRIQILKNTPYANLTPIAKTEIKNLGEAGVKYYESVEFDEETTTEPIGKWATVSIYEDNKTEAIGKFKYFCIKGKKSLTEVPVGTIISWGGKVGTPGEEWLLCDGSTFSSSKYPDLVSVLGGTVLPNLNDGRFLEGNQTDYGRSIEAGLPNITGTTANSNDLNSYRHVFTGAFYWYYNDGSARNANDCDGGSVARIGFDASRCSSIYGASDTVQPKAYRVRYYIKAL